MTKEEERAELHRVIWNMAEELRGSVDGWDFKSYVLGFLFYRFISENITYYINKLEHNTGNIKFDYTKISDEKAELGKKSIVKEKGFFIYPSELCANIKQTAKKDDDLNVKLEKIFKNIENSAKGTASEGSLKGLFDDIDVNSKKLGKSVSERNKRLLAIIEAISNLKFGEFTENSIDLFGDAYEYLMTMYASNAGKSGGEFFTPQEVSELLAKITLVDPKGKMKKEINKVYDPACGSGSLLLKYEKILGSEKVRQGFYGQEINIITYNLCRINMFLHNISYEKFDIAHGDTLISPKHFEEEPFDAIVSNPPYSKKWASNEDATLINDPRFAPAGVLAPKSYADLAFTMHILSWLSTQGTAAIVEFPGILYRGNSEQKIRKYLIDNNFVDCVIQLPQNLFFGVSIATCILVLKKCKTDNSVLFIDGSSEFVHLGNKNKLSDQNIENLLNIYIERQNKKYFSKLVKNKSIAENGYDLSVSKYIEQKNTKEIIDIMNLNISVKKIVARQNELRKKIDAIVADLEGTTV